ncbi:hypothetical protein HGG70_08285, partial [Rhodobacteraceae bacterium R_SAG4]|nr:hypothetical protein [Rhodobacteraceae bacterium R_SAG4]
RERAILEKREADERSRIQKQAFDDRIELETESLRKLYRAAEDASYEKLIEDTSAARQAGQSGRAEQEAYQERRIANETALLKGILKTTDAQIAEARTMVSAGELNASVVTQMLADRDELQRKIEQTDEKTFSIDLLLGTESEQKKFERLLRTFNSAEDRVKSLGAELNGASGEVAKLYHQIKRGDFGRIEEADEQTQKLIQSLSDATIAAEAMDNVLKATDKAHSEITRIYENLLEENAKYLAQINGVDTDDALAFFNFKKDNGLLEGLGLTPEETVKKALETVTSGIDLSATQFRTLGQTMREEAFGENTISQIDKVAEAIGRIQGSVSVLTSSTSGILPIGGVLGSVSSSYVGASGTGAARSFLDIIAQAEGTDFNAQAKGYNTTLDFDKWTGPLDLVNMTLKEILVIQDRMVQQTKDIYGDSEGRRGSSALGRYQITGSTLRDAIKRMGLDENAKFDASLQDSIALWLADQSVGAGRSIGSRWQGVEVRKIESEARAAYDAARNSYAGELLAGATQQQNRIDEVNNKALNLEPQVRANQREALLATSIEELTNELTSLGSKDELGSVGTKEEGVRELIAGGKLGSGSTDVTAAEYEKILGIAREIDETNAQIARHKKDDTEITRNLEKLEEERAEIAERRRVAEEQANNPNYKGLSTDLQKLNQLEKEHLSIVERRFGGKGTDEYKAAVAEFAQQRAQLLGAESAEALNALTKEANAAEIASRSEKEQRQELFKQRVQELEALKEQAIRNGMNVAEAEKQFNRAVAAERTMLLDQYTGGLRQTLDQMGDLEGNINSLSSSWASGLSDALYGVASGDSGAFQAFGNAIRESIARALTDKAAETLMRPFETLIAGDGSEGSGIGGIFGKAFKNIGGMDFSSMFSGVKDWLS